MVFSFCGAQVSITMSTILFEIPVHGVAHAVVSGHRTPIAAGTKSSLKTEFLSMRY